MHKSSLLRMNWFVKNYASKMDGSNISVLDVGSYDINGSYKNLFDSEKFEYFGLDMEDGPNVDIVLGNPYDWGSIKTSSFDIIISGQAFEHVEFFWITMSEIVRVTKKGGLICIIAPLGFKEHRFPVDCYRFHTDGMIALARYCSLEIIHTHTNCGPSLDCYEWYSVPRADSMLIAKKPYGGKTKHPDLKTYRCEPGDHAKLRGKLVSGM